MRSSGTESTARSFAWWGGTAAGTTATFSQAGTYVLRMTASDGEYTSSDEVTVVRDTRGKDGGRESWRKFLYCFPQARLRLIPDAPGYRAASGAEDLDLAEGVIVHSNGEVTRARRDSMLLVQPFQPVA